MVDNAHSQLVTCGTVFQGTCQNRRLSNISVFETYLKDESGYGFVASTNPSFPAVAFTAPGPENTVSLYVGTYDRPKSRLYTARQYTLGVSRRYLNADDMFKIKLLDEDSNGPFAQLTRNAANSSAFVVTYVAGFSVGSFSYFLTTQPAVYPPTGSTQRISKLSQVCHNDPLFDSYVEMPIFCQSGVKGYNLVQAATVLQPGANLASELNIPVSEHLLVAAFYDSVDSALCVYSISDIRQRFTENIEACYNFTFLLIGRQFRGDAQCNSLFPPVSQTIFSHFDSYVYIF